ncbi:MAG: hypothetical protein AAFN06_10395 [Pseudomonadota bacterium]
MIDNFEDHSLSLTAPVTSAETVSPSDTSDLAHVSRAIYIGVGGELSVQMVSGETVTFSNVLAGTWLPLRVGRVMSTGTTAAALLSLY